MKDYPKYSMRIFITFSQFLNVVFFNGWPDEMLSARAYREKWDKVQLILDLIFSMLGQKDHCKQCYFWEKHRNDLPFYKKNMEN